MAFDLFSDKTWSTLSRALDGYALRQTTIANNIANAETPGYQRREVSFESDLKEALEAPGPGGAKKALAEFQPVSDIDTDSPARPDGNNVNMDREVADLSKNSLSYRAATTILELKGSILKYVINEK